MVNPTIKKFVPIDIFFVKKICSYAQIGKYCEQLSAMFAYKGNDFTTLAVFEEQGYRPKKSHIKISVIAKKGMKIKEKYATTIQRMQFNPGKVLTYTHNGSGNLLSLFWKELEKYCFIHKIKIRTNIPDFEIYRKVNKDISKQFFEIYLPIK